MKCYMLLISRSCLFVICVTQMSISLHRFTDSSTNGTPQESKKNKKKSKNHDKDLSNTQEPANQVEAEEKKQPQKTRTFGNGLIIEELSMGKPDGKRASPGNKVSFSCLFLSSLS